MRELPGRIVLLAECVRCHFSRLKKEYAQLSESPPHGTTISLPCDSDLYVWEAFIDGPSDSLYDGVVLFNIICHFYPNFCFFAGGRFKVQIVVSYLTNDTLVCVNNIISDTSLFLIPT